MTTISKSHLVRAVHAVWSSLAIVSVGVVLAASPETLSAQTNATTHGNQMTGTAPRALTLLDALGLARKNNPEYRATVTQFRLATQDRIQSRAALLPSVNYTSEFIYTESNGTGMNSPRFIANNAVHEYVSQGNIHQIISLENVAEFRRTQAAEAIARARAEIAARGLVV